MISVFEAKRIINENVSNLSPVDLPLLEASGLIAGAGLDETNALKDSKTAGRQD